MNPTPLVSVITIFLDAERFIAEAIESVLAQRYESWELLLVDDGSTDASTAIAKRYAGAHPGRVRYLEHEAHRNRGMSASRNLGIAAAKGEYVAFLDADDVWLPHKLERQVAILESRPEAGMVVGAPQYWHSWTGSPEDGRRDHVPALGVEPDTLFTPPALLTQTLAGAAIPPCPSDVLVRRDVVDRVGAFVDEFRDLYEDQVFFSKVYLDAPVFVSGECWDRYRQHPGSCYASAKRAGTRHAARRRYLAWLKKYLAARGITHPEVRRALRCELRPHRVWRRAVDGVRRRGVRLAVASARMVLLHALPSRLVRRLREPSSVPPPGAVRLGHLRRLAPLSRRFGLDRGLPVDRYYIERFLGANAADVRGSVLEIKDDIYTRRFGGDRVLESHVLHVEAGNPRATMVADLTAAPGIPAAAFDCVILTQVLQFIEDPRAAIRTLHRILKPGGVVLATVAGISQIDRHEMDRWGDFWRFTTLSARRLFEEAFPGRVRVAGHGNVLTAAAFLYGLTAGELAREELEHDDPDYQVLITVRAVKADEHGSR